MSKDFVMSVSVHIGGVEYDFSRMTLKELQDLRLQFQIGISAIDVFLEPRDKADEPT